MTKIFSGNKKANAVLDTITVIVMLFAFTLTMIFGYNIYQKIYPQMKAQVDVNSTADIILTRSYDRYPPLFDNLVLFIFVALWILGLVASYMIDTHPIFFILTVVLLLFVMVGAIYMSNFYEGITTSTADLESTAVLFVKTNWIMSHLLELTIVMGMSIALVLYAKLR